MKIYVAGPLFSQAEQDYNRMLADELEFAGFEVFLPQEECKNLVGVGNRWSKDVFEKCKYGVDWADALVTVLDGADPDSGTCWEFGYAYGGDKPIAGLRTDFRNGGDCSKQVNLMLAESAVGIYDNIQKVIAALNEIEEKMAK